MKGLLLVFTLINLACVQVLASSCGVMCDYNERLEQLSQKEQQPTAPMKANHECCHGKGSQKADKTKGNPFKCIGELGGVCFQDVTADTQEALNPEMFILGHSFLIAPQTALYSPLVLNPIPKESLTPDVRHGGTNYLKYKERLVLHILKDQFLI